VTASFYRQAGRQASDFFNPYFESEAGSCVTYFQKSYLAGLLDGTRCLHYMSSWLWTGISESLASLKFSKKKFSFGFKVLCRHIAKVRYRKTGWYFLKKKKKNSSGIKILGKNRTLINMPVVIILSLILDSRVRFLVGGGREPGVW